MRKVPLIGSAYSLVDEGCIPGASFRNLDFVENDSHLGKNLDYNLKMIACDAQTSGGLLISVPCEKTEALVKDLHDAGLRYSAIIGDVSTKKHKFLYLNN
jgi:selenide,water dikinase